MGKITNEMIEISFEIGKKLYNNSLSLKDGKKILHDMGMNEDSAVVYIYNYSNLIQGKLFTRTTNIYGTEYYLQKIYEENGITGLQNALLALSQHFEYYEKKSGTTVNKRKEIYYRFLKILGENNFQPIYADEIDPELNYSEGKTKQVLVNSFERNHVARIKCIEHYGLKCQVCGLSFYEKYGELGRNFIHVHHKLDLSTIGVEYSVDPITDLIPVCPNCHSMLHMKKPSYTVDELKGITKGVLPLTERVRN